MKMFLEKIKEQLEKEKISTEEELKKIAKKDTKPTGDWDTRFPHFDGESGGASLETAADEIEEYEARLPIEFQLETRLRDINLALEKIKKGNYGVCEKCGEKIPRTRLNVCPEAKFCLKCKQKT